MVVFLRGATNLTSFEKLERKMCFKICLTITVSSTDILLVYYKIRMHRIIVYSLGMSEHIW